MSSKKAKEIRRKVRKEADKIKVQGLHEFVDFCYGRSFFRRVNIALKIVFKRVNYD